MPGRSYNFSIIWKMYTLHLYANVTIILYKPLINRIIFNFITLIFFCNHRRIIYKKSGLPPTYLVGIAKRQYIHTRRQPMMGRACFRIYFLKIWRFKRVWSSLFIISVTNLNINSLILEKIWIKKFLIMGLPLKQGDCGRRRDAVFI